MKTNEQPVQQTRLWVGLLIATVGVLILLAKLDLLTLPLDLFSWQTLLIAIGVVLGISSRFKNPASYILILIGGFFLLDEWLVDTNIRPYFWPILLIVLGLWFAFSRFRLPGSNELQPIGASNEENQVQGDEFLRATVIMGGLKRQFTSKLLRGGEVVALLGGLEVYFQDTQIESNAVLDITLLFAGIKLVVPPDWEVRSEATAIAGGVEDKRPVNANISTGKLQKVLVLKGTVLFGGVEIKTRG
jgi:predicted membrane protein